MWFKHSAQFYVTVFLIALAASILPWVFLPSTPIQVAGLWIVSARSATGTVLSLMLLIELMRRYLG